MVEHKNKPDRCLPRTRMKTIDYLSIRRASVSDLLVVFYEEDDVAAILGEKFYLKGSGNFPADAGQA